MILVDRDIRQLGNTAIDGFDENNIGPISYDVSIGEIIADNKNVDVYELQPGEAIFIKTAERIKVPTDLMVRVGQKNSKMRMMLLVDGPNYFPGHETFMFLRLMNMSQNTIELEKGDKIAQIFFEKLSGVPDVPYNQQKGASFNEEDRYRGYGNYQQEYEKKIKKVNDAKEKLEDMVSNIYTNIMTIMGVFVAIFSLIMVNFTNLNSDLAMNPKTLITINISLGIIIALFLGLILIFMNKAKNKKFLIAYVLIMLVLVVALLIMF